MTTSDDTILKLIRDLREMDQLVYQMQTANSGHQLRSAVQRAWAITETRMNAESKRIEALMIPEIKKAYTKLDTVTPSISPPLKRLR